MLPINILKRIVQHLFRSKVDYFVREEERENSPCSAAILNSGLKHAKTTPYYSPDSPSLESILGRIYCDLNLWGYPAPLSITNSL